MNPKVDFYFNKAGKWYDELELLRQIALSTGLAEELKWGCPCYVLEKGNVVLIHVFKEYCALLFFKGALLNDDAGLLVQQTEQVQAARQLRFTSAAQIAEQEPLIQAYLQQAINAEKAGLKVELKKHTDLVHPVEFQAKLDEMPELKAAFDALTPGRQRAYDMYFSEPKLAKTREARVEKSLLQILDGKGLND